VHAFVRECARVVGWVLASLALLLVRLAIKSSITQHWEIGSGAVHTYCTATCAGPYRHYALYNRTYTTILSTPPRNWTGTPSSWKLQLDVSTCREWGWFQTQAL
jgi:hypothetical protein